MGFSKLAFESIFAFGVVGREAVAVLLGGEENHVSSIFQYNNFQQAHYAQQ